MAENKKISELTRVSSLTGAEIVPFAKDGSNGAVTTAKLKEYAQPDLSAITTALGGKVDKVTGKGLSANDYTDADRTKLGALPTSTQLTEKIDEAKLALFIDQWNAACGSFGKYNPANAPDAQHPFYLNTLWLTYAEAIKIAEQKPSWGTRQTDFLWRNIKTNIPQLIGAVASAYGNCFSNIEVVNLKYLSPTSMGTCFTGKDNKSVLNFNAYMLESASGCFKAPNLEVLEISNLKISLDLSKCPLINLASWQGLVTNAVNTAPITVTVHPDVYAKLTDEQADATALLPENLLEDILNHSAGVTVIDGGAEFTAGRQYVRFYHSPRLVDKGIGKLTISCDVEGLNEGESITFAIGAANDVPRPQWTISDNGRAVFSFDAAAYINDPTNQNGFLLYDGIGTYTGQGLKLTNFKLSYGAHDTLPYTAPLSSVTDTELREKAEWLSLMQIAEARQINFITTA